MSTISLALDEIYDLAKKTLLSNGCDEENANILADTIMRAERDGSHSHGLFRLPAYVAALKSKTMNLAFDVTPAKYVTGLITEKGVCKASEEGLKGLFK